MGYCKEACIKMIMERESEQETHWGRVGFARERTREEARLWRKMRETERKGKGERSANGSLEKSGRRLEELG